MPNENGQTRRERYLEMEEVAEAPPLIIPETGRYIWDWFFDLRGSIRRVRDNVCEPYPPTEFLAWATMSGAIVRAREWVILRAMDGAYCEAMNAELVAYQERQADAEAQKTGRG